MFNCDRRHFRNIKKDIEMPEKSSIKYQINKTVKYKVRDDFSVKGRSVADAISVGLLLLFNKVLPIKAITNIFFFDWRFTHLHTYTQNSILDYLILYPLLNVQTSPEQCVTLFVWIFLTQKSIYVFFLLYQADDWLK